MPLPLQAMTPGALVAAVPGTTLAEARKIIAMVHRGEAVSATSFVRRVTADAVSAATHQPQLTVREVVASAIDPFVKYALVTRDGHAIEMVRIPLADPGRFSVCVSSQVGCALACAFCATGRLGLARNLEAWEIIEQIRLARRDLPAGGRVHGVVFQGMGEPLANLDAVLGAIAVASESSALGIDARSITVCTAGLPQGIRRLAKEAPKVRLGMSIGSLHADRRRRLMPIDRAHDFAEVFEAAVEHALATRLSPMWAVALLADHNDGDDDARALAAAAHEFARRTGRAPRITLIPYNSLGAADPFRRSSAEREHAFRGILAASGLAHHKRYSGGGDVGAACGQLGSVAAAS